MFSLSKHIFLWGLPGSGKSMALSYIRDVLPLPVIDLDDYIAAKEGYSIQEIFELKGEPGFRDIEKESLKTILEMPECIVATGGGTPCFGDNAHLMLQQGIPIWLDVPLDQILIQLDHSDENRPLFNPITTHERKAYINQIYGERAPFYQQAPYQIKVTESMGWLPGLAGLIWAQAYQRD